jgi:hypothetical protein
VEAIHASAALMGKNKRQRRSLPPPLCPGSVPANTGCAELADAMAGYAAISRCEAATIAALMVARRRRRALFGLMSAKTASWLCPKMRKPIIRPHKKVYGRKVKPPPKSCLALSAETVDTPAPPPAKRLDKQETIELAKATLCAICLTSTTPSNAKASAARTLLELVGAIGRHADPTSMNTIPASEMSLEQLEARIAALVTH